MITQTDFEETPFKRSDYKLFYLGTHVHLLLFLPL